MEATSDVGVVDKLYQLIIGSAFEVAVAFAQIHVDFHRVLDGRHSGLRSQVGDAP